MWFWLLEEADGIVFLTANLTVSMVDPGALMLPAATELADLCDSTGIAPPPAAAAVGRGKASPTTLKAIRRLSIISRLFLSSAILA